MQTVLIGGKDIADFDWQIARQLALITGTEKTVRAERMQIGIRNENGDIYRALGVTDPDRFLDAISKLFDIGLMDELQKEDGPRHGYDAIFSLRKS